MTIPSTRRYRVLDPSLYHEVTQRIRDGKFLLDPNCPLLKAAIYGQLARSLARYKITLIALHFMSDHFHALYGTTCPYRLAKFFAHFHSGITRAYNRLRAAANPDIEVEPVALWHEMGWMPVATDEATIRWRLRYIMGQAVAANLVDHPVQFPGASTIDAMIDGVPMIGRTFDATKRYRDSRLDAGAQEDANYEEELELFVTPPSCWAHLSAKELQRCYIEVADSAARIPLAELRRAKVVVPNVATWGCVGPEYPERSDQAGADSDAARQTSESVAFEPSPSSVQPSSAELPDTATPADSAGFANPGQWQAHCANEQFQPSPGEKVHIPPRVGTDGQPYAAGRAKPKKSYYTADGKRKKRPLILALSASVCEAYEQAYNLWVEQYQQAKERCRESMALTTAGLAAPALAIPPFMLLGSMPYPKT